MKANSFSRHGGEKPTPGTLDFTSLLGHENSLLQGVTAGFCTYVLAFAFVLLFLLCSFFFKWEVAWK